MIRAQVTTGLLAFRCSRPAALLSAPQCWCVGMPGSTRPYGSQGQADQRAGIHPNCCAVWTRGVLESEFGIAPSDMTFFMGRVPERKPCRAIGFEKAPPRITISQIPPEKSIASMLLGGELDTYMAYFRKHSVDMIDRSYVDLENHPISSRALPARCRSRPLLRGRLESIRSITAWRSKLPGIRYVSPGS